MISSAMLQGLDFDKVKSYFELLQSNKLNAFKQHLNELEQNPYTEKNTLTHVETEIANLQKFYQNLNTELYTLKQYQLEKNFPNGEVLINTLYHPDTLKLFSSPSFNHKTNKFVTNELFLLLQNLNKLHKTTATLNPSNIQDQTMQPLADNVCIHAIELMVDIIDQQQVYYKKETGELLFKDSFGKLANTIVVITNCIQNPSQDEKQYGNLSAAITELENTLEHPAERFARKRPVLTAFISAATLLAGAGMFFGSIVLLPIVTVIAIPLMLASISIIMASLIALAGSALKIHDTSKAIYLNNKLVIQNEKTATSMRSLVTTTHSMFAKPKTIADTATNNMVSTSRDGLLA